MKKPAHTSLSFDDLHKQVRKYKAAVEEYYKDKLPAAPQPPIDIYVLIAKTPTGFSESDRQSLAAQNGQIITYQQLITDAINAYQTYLDAMKNTGSLEIILAKL